MNNPTQDAPIVNPPRATLTTWQQRLNPSPLLVRKPEMLRHPTVSSRNGESHHSPRRNPNWVRTLNDLIIRLRSTFLRSTGAVHSTASLAMRHRVRRSWSNYLRQNTSAKLSDMLKADGAAIGELTSLHEITLIDRRVDVALLKKLKRNQRRNTWLSC